MPSRKRRNKKVLKPNIPADTACNLTIIKRSDPNSIYDAGIIKTHEDEGYSELESDVENADNQEESCDMGGPGLLSSDDISLHLNFSCFYQLDIFTSAILSSKYDPGPAKDAQDHFISYEEIILKDKIYRLKEHRYFYGLVNSATEDNKDSYDIDLHQPPKQKDFLTELSSTMNVEFEPKTDGPNSNMKTSVKGLETLKRQEKITVSEIHNEPLTTRNKPIAEIPRRSRRTCIHDHNHNKTNGPNSSLSSNMKTSDKGLETLKKKEEITVPKIHDEPLTTHCKKPIAETPRRSKRSCINEHNHDKTDRPNSSLSSNMKTSVKDLKTLKRKEKITVSKIHKEPLTTHCKKPIAETPRRSRRSCVNDHNHNKSKVSQEAIALSISKEAAIMDKDRSILEQCTGTSSRSKRSCVNPSLNYEESFIILDKLNKSLSKNLKTSAKGLETTVPKIHDEQLTAHCKKPIAETPRRSRRSCVNDNNHNKTNGPNLSLSSNMRTSVKGLETLKRKKEVTVPKIHNEPLSTHYKKPKINILSNITIKKPQEAITLSDSKEAAIIDKDHSILEQSIGTSSRSKRSCVNYSLNYDETDQLNKSLSKKWKNSYKILTTAKRKNRVSKKGSISKMKTEIPVFKIPDIPDISVRNRKSRKLYSLETFLESKEADLCCTVNES